MSHESPRWSKVRLEPASASLFYEVRLDLALWACETEIPTHLLNSVSMLVPFAMPHPIRSMDKSATAILRVKMALAVAWSVQVTAPFVAVAFLGTCLYSFVVCGVG